MFILSSTALHFDLPPLYDPDLMLQFSHHAIGDFDLPPLFDPPLMLQFNQRAG